jgi:hypothetical protein
MPSAPRQEAHTLPLPVTASTEPDNTGRNKAVFFIISSFVVTCGLYYIAQSSGDGNTLGSFALLLFAFIVITFILGVAFERFSSGP